MTDNEIIKELQCASEWFTQHGRNTNTAVIGICDRAVDLINRQKAEIEKLGLSLESMLFEVKNAHELRDEAIINAIETFAERLKDKQFYECLGEGWEGYLVYSDDIDNLVKEMLGEQE